MFTLNCCREYRNCQFAEFNGGVHFFCFRPEIPFLGKFDPKTRNGQFKLKFGTQTKWNLQHSVVIFTFSVLNQKYPFWQNFGIKTNLNMHDSVVWFIFPTFNWKYPVQANLVQKSKLSV